MLACSARCLRPTAAATQQPKRCASSLADKFSLEALNGGKNPFQVSSDALLKPTPGMASSTAAAATRLSKNAHKSEDSVKNLYSLDYLLGKAPVETKKPKANPFDVPSAKLM